MAGARSSSIVDETLYVDSTGGFVTDAFCKALVDNRLPKNLVTQLRKSISTEAEDNEGKEGSGGELLPWEANRKKVLTNDELLSKIRSLFPFAVKMKNAKEIILKELRKENYTMSNTVFGRCQCPCDSQYMFQNCGVCGECVSIGGIAGFPAIGRKGMTMLDDSKPANGKLIIIYGPHIGIDQFGKLWKTNRIEIQSDSNRTIKACAPVIEAYENLSANPDLEIKRENFYRDEQNYLVNATIKKHFFKLANAQDPNITLPYMILEEIRSLLLEDLVDIHSVALIGGIQINTPGDCEEYFLLEHFEVREPRTKDEGRKEEFITRNFYRRFEKRANEEGYFFTSKAKEENYHQGDQETEGKEEKSSDDHQDDTAKNTTVEKDKEDQQNWTKHLDEQTGHYYWYNEITHESKWEK
eukprot:g426.t1